MVQKKVPKENGAQSTRRPLTGTLRSSKNRARVTEGNARGTTRAMLRIDRAQTVLA